MFAVDAVGDALRALAEDGSFRVAIRRNKDDDIELERLSSASDRARANAKHRKCIDDMLKLQPVIIAMSSLAKGGVFEVRPAAKATAKKAADGCFAISLRKRAGAEPSTDVFETTLKDGPSCKGCGQPMKALAVLHAHEQRLPLQKHEAVGVFVCARPSGDDWDAWWSSCAIANPDAKGGLTVSLYEKAPATKGGRPAYYKAVEDRDEEESEDGEERPLDGSKLGGKARWSTAIDAPDEGHGAWNRPMKCPKCKKLMRFRGQLMTMPEVKFDAGDGFGIYLFVCADEHAADLSCFVD